MADYINKKDFNDEMLKCINNDRLTDKSIELFRLLATEVSKTFNFKYQADKEDAIDNAVADFANNWRGYKWKPVFKMKLLRNFKDGESLVIEVPNVKKITVVAKTTIRSPYHFKIETKENKTLENLASVIEKLTNSDISCSLHKVTMKITLVDNINCIGTYGKVTINTLPLSKAIIKFTDRNTNEEPFAEPPPAFNWSTSVCRNGIIKSIDKMRPKEWRKGKMINFSEIMNKKGGSFDD